MKYDWGMLHVLENKGCICGMTQLVKHGMIMWLVGVQRKDKDDWILRKEIYDSQVEEEGYKS